MRAPSSHPIFLPYALSHYLTPLLITSPLPARDSWGSVHEWGVALGTEFYNKGANVQLGPGVCISRVPHNGRTFEYVSGEDPFLGRKMSAAAVSGIQSKGVIANLKHYVNNNQETQRGSISDNVDERTQFEIYYPPFEGGIDVGLGSIMCSYNKIGSVKARASQTFPSQGHAARWSY